MTYPIVEKREWRCFHCDELFTSEGCARTHFGLDEGATPACVIKGSETGLVEALREAERAADEAIQLMHSESTDAARAYHSQRCRHEQALRSMEEVGYSRGLADGRNESAAHIEALAEVVEYYADTFCEFGRHNEGCGKYGPDICAGCYARTALSNLREGGGQ